MLGNLSKSIGTRLIVLVGILGVVLVIIGTLGLRGMAQSNAALNTVYQDRVVPLRDLKIIADMYAVNIVDTTHKVRDGIIGWPQARKNLDEANATIARKWKEYTATYLVEEEKKLVAEIEPMFKETGIALGRLKDILTNEDKAAVAEFAAGPLYPAIDPISEKFSQIIEIQLVVAKREYDKASTDYRSTRYANITIIVLSLILGVGAALWIIRSITRPLSRLQDITVQVEQAGDCTLRVGATGQDEVGRTAAAFDRMMARIATLIGETRDSADAIAAAAQSMTTAGEKVKTSSSAQAEAAAAVAAAVEQTSVSISETASNARKADETASHARADIERTLSAVRETADNVDQLAGMIGEASGDIARLAESSRQIDGIVRTIKEVAGQTARPALNAASEAASAGEQGRGFAVVADEVRKLAENTARSTNEIGGLIGSVQAEVATAVARMQAANEKAGTTRERVIASTDALDAASTDTGRVTETVRNIADAVREQDVAVQQVAQRMEQIAQMTEENTATASSAAETAQHLDILAGKLHASIKQFKA